MKVVVILLLLGALRVPSSGQTDNTIADLKTPDSVFVNGRITLPDGKSRSIFFVFWDQLLGINRKEYAMLDENGRFEIKLFIRSTSPILWRYQGKETQDGFLIVSPGDSLTIIIEGSAVTFSGRNAAASADYYHMRSRQEWADYYYTLDTGYRLEPEAYLDFRKERYEKELEFFQKYCKDRDCSELFEKWYAVDLKVLYFFDLLSYSWKSATYGLGSEVRLTGRRKEKYDSASFKDIDLDDSTYSMSSAYTPFLITYAQKVAKSTPFDQVYNEIYTAKLNILQDIISKQVGLEINEHSSAKRTLQNLLEKVHAKTEPDSTDLKVMWKLSEQYELPLQRAMDMWKTDAWVETLKSVPHRKTRELYAVNTFMDQIDTHPNLDYFYEKIAPLVQDKATADILANEYKRKKDEDALINKKQRGIEIIPKNYEKSADRLLSDIVKANAGKLIMIDFWATWCSPCLADFQKIRGIKQKLPSDSISFVYLCSQSSPSIWAKQINKFNVQGQHYIISETQFAEYQKRFGLKGFPSYIFIDARKRIHKNVSMNDVRNEKVLLSKIEQLMDNDN
jgi:thiol-disulfide isomerase/thioredoxin